MDIDEYLRRKKALEEEKTLLEGERKISKKKVVDSQPRPSPEPQRPMPPSSPTPVSGGGAGMRNFMIINMVLLIGVLGVFATFYLFPPNGDTDVIDNNKITGKVALEKDKDEDTKKPDPVEQKKPVNESKKNDTKKKDETVYLAPKFTFDLKDVTEGEFNENGKLKGSGKVLVFNGKNYYDDFELTIQNKEKDKILCEIDRKIDIDTDLNGRTDIEDVHSLSRHTIKIKGAQKEVLKAGIESVPGNVDDYKGKGEVHVEYETRCYFCNDIDCSDWEERGEAKQTQFFRVRINENKFFQNDSNKSS